MACAWHRQVRRADARRSQAHAAKRQQEQRGKPNRKARRSGAVPALSLSPAKCVILQENTEFTNFMFSRHWSIVPPPTGDPTHQPHHKIKDFATGSPLYISGSPGKNL